METKKEILTKENLIEAYKELFNTIGYDNNFKGYKDTISTFELCSNYDLGLNDSTIDKIELTEDGRIYFYYNQNTNDLDPIEVFSFEELKEFYYGLINAWGEAI